MTQRTKQSDIQALSADILRANCARTTALGVGLFDREYAKVRGASGDEAAADTKVAFRTEAELLAFLQIPYCPHPPATGTPIIVEL